MQATSMSRRQMLGALAACAIPTAPPPVVGRHYQHRGYRFRVDSLDGGVFVSRTNLATGRVRLLSVERSVWDREMVGGEMLPKGTVPA